MTIFFKYDQLSQFFPSAILFFPVDTLFKCNLFFKICDPFFPIETHSILTHFSSKCETISQKWAIFPSVAHMIFSKYHQFFPSILEVWPIVPTATFSECNPFFSVTHFSKGELFSQVWLFFQVWPFCEKSEPFCQVWPIFLSLTQLILSITVFSKWKPLFLGMIHFSSVIQFFKCYIFVQVWHIFLNVNFFPMWPIFLSVTYFSMFVLFFQCNPVF